MEARGQPTGRVAVIMPTYNERANVESTAGRIRRAVPGGGLPVPGGAAHCPCRPGTAYRPLRPGWALFPAGWRRYD